MANNLFRTRLVIDGYNQLRLLKTLSDSGIKLLNVQKITNGRLKVTIKSRFKAKTFAILKKLCYNYQVEWDYSIKSCLYHLLYRAGLILGFAIGIASCIALSNTVLLVKIEGLSANDAIEVNRIIQEGVSLPVSARVMDLQSAKKFILDGGKVADCNLKIKGNYLIVEALPVINSQPEPEENSQILSSCDAVITKIICVKGTSLVKRGDVVKKGELLISGDIYDSAGESVINTVIPEAIIYGEVTERFTRLVSETQIQSKRTGRIAQKSFLSLPWQTPYFCSPYEHFDKEQQTSILSAFLPLTYRKITYYERVANSVTVDVTSEAEAFLRECTTFMPYEIKSSKYDVIDVGGGTKKISVYVMREKIIS